MISGGGRHLRPACLERSQGVQDQAMREPAPAGLGLATDAPAGSVDATMVYIAAEGTQPIHGSGEAGAQREFRLLRFHSRILQRVRSAEGGKAIIFQRGRTEWH